MTKTDVGYVIGDFHLGAGDALDDFDQDDRFAAFLGKIQGSDTTLFINGDFVDFAQIPPFEVHSSDRYLWTEEASVQKLRVAMEAHSTCFGALRDLLASGANVCFMTGNHDLDMTWDRVQDALQQSFNPPAPSQLQFEDTFRVFHGVHVQHGFHFCPENCPENPNEFTHDVDGTRYLERVWGTDFLLNFFNRIETEYRFADNVKPHWLVLLHGIKNGWLPKREAAAMVWRLGRFLRRRGVSISTVTGAVLSSESSAEALSPPMAMSLLKSAFDPSSSEPIDMLQSLDQASKEALVEAARELSAEDLQEIRGGSPSDLGQAEVDFKEVTTPSEDSDLLGVVRPPRDVRAARDLLSPSVTAVVFGHTHKVVDGSEPSTVGYWNPGTWLPNLDLRDPDVKLALRDGVTKEVLEADNLFRTNRLAVEVRANDPYAATVRLVEVDTL